MTHMKVLWYIGASVVASKPYIVTNVHLFYVTFPSVIPTTEGRSVSLANKVSHHLPCRQGYTR